MITKQNAYDVVQSLITNMHEGFHGTSYEMCEQLRECDERIFDHYVNHAMCDVFVVERAREFATCDNEIVDDDYQYYFNDHVMQTMYRNVCAQMCNIVIDETNRHVNDATMSLTINCHDMSRVIVETIIDELCACIVDDDDVIDTYFTSDFFKTFIR